MRAHLEILDSLDAVRRGFGLVLVPLAMVLPELGQPCLAWLEAERGLLVTGTKLRGPPKQESMSQALPEQKAPRA